MTTTTHPTTATPAHEHLPIEQIRILEGANARSTMHPDKLDELVASVTASGVLQPVIVQRTSNAQQPFVLIAGHRRVEASRRASRATIPALIYDALNAAEQMQIALVENLQREDLNAIDEARGYQQAIQHANLTQSKLAELTGKSASHISQRLALLKLPDACQGYIASGEVPLPASKSLAHIATVSTQIADTCAKLLVDGHVEPHELIEQPHVVIEVIANDLDDDDAPFVHGVDWHGPIRFRGALTEEQVDELRQRAQAVQMRRFVFTSDDVDAARSYGCLLEFEHQFGSHRFLTDPEWTHDRLCKQLDEREAAAAAARTDDVRSAEHDAGAATAAKTSGDAQGDGDKSSVTQRLERLKREQDERRAQRAADQAKRDAAITANRQLGTTLERLRARRVPDRARRVRAAPEQPHGGTWHPVHTPRVPPARAHAQQVQRSDAHPLHRHRTARGARQGARMGAQAVPARGHHRTAAATDRGGHVRRPGRRRADPSRDVGPPGLHDADPRADRQTRDQAPARALPRRRQANAARAEEAEHHRQEREDHGQVEAGVQGRDEAEGEEGEGRHQREEAREQQAHEQQGGDVEEARSVEGVQHVQAEGTAHGGVQCSLTTRHLHDVGRIRLASASYGCFRPRREPSRYVPTPRPSDRS